MLFSPQEMQDNQLRLEHYKSRKTEYQNLMNQIQSLWTYKLSTLGAVIAITIFNDKLIGTDVYAQNLGLSGDLIVAIGLLALPVLSLVIDLKVVEIIVHLKLISNHLTNNYSDVKEVVAWTNALWDGDWKSISFTRTFLSMVLFVGMSVIILLLSFLSVALSNQNGNHG